MSAADCTPGREPRNVAASFLIKMAACIVILQCRQFRYDAKL